MNRRRFFGGTAALALLGPRAMVAWSDEIRRRYAQGSLEWLARGMVLWAESVAAFAKWDYAKGAELTRDYTRCLAKAAACGMTSQGLRQPEAKDTEWLLC